MGSGGSAANVGAGGSGIMCCVSLPAKWQPGMRLVVQTKDETKAKTAAEWSKENIPLKLRMVEVPRYEASDVGTVWVQFLPNDNVALVVSRYDPSNSNWPGAIKGWPKPSVEYRRVLWDRDSDLLKKQLLKMQKAKEMATQSEDRSGYQEAIDSVVWELKLLGRRP
ncbi:DUF3304 domain-containing protein [Chromobacterium vaccinii]|uniref:DUF3304 domain-containing protein n=1 Tax=Chromobacterium vaccinii TaxID=1108595 RepID=UPI0022AC589D|nr:DUF3304 domain-containing protein [Chromobacterium vaccinii]